MDYTHYYKRQISLWGDDTQKLLKDKRVAIVGCGGLGSSLALALGGSGIGEIVLIDFDIVSFHNIHRQIALRVEDVGATKASVVANVIAQRNPFVKAEVFEADFDTFAKIGDSRFDLIIDATDNIQTRQEIDRWAKEHDIPWVYGAVEGFNAQVCLFKDGDFNIFAAKEHTPDGVAAPMVMQAASLEANLALRYLAGLPVATDTLYYLSYNSDGEFIVQKFKIKEHKSG